MRYPNKIVKMDENIREEEKSGVETFYNLSGSCSQFENSHKAPFTEVTLEDSNHKKLPKRILHFSDGILEEYSTEEEDETDNDKAALIDPKTLTWLPYLWYLVLWVGSRTLSVCDYLGEHLANFFGITSPKFQYEIQEFQRIIEEEEYEKKREAEENFGWNKNDPENIYQPVNASKIQNNEASVVRTEPLMTANFTNIAKEITDVVESVQNSEQASTVYRRF